MKVYVLYCRNFSLFLAFEFLCYKFYTLATDSSTFKMILKLDRRDANDEKIKNQAKMNYEL